MFSQSLKPLVWLTNNKFLKVVTTDDEPKLSAALESTKPNLWTLATKIEAETSGNGHMGGI